MMIFAILEGSKAFMPKPSSQSRAFGLAATSSKPTTDFVAKQLIKALNDPSFVDPNKGAEKKIFGKMMRTLVSHSC